MLNFSPFPFHLLGFVSLRKANLEVRGHLVRPQAADGRTWQQGHILCSLPPSTRSRIGFLKPMASTIFSYHFHPWPGYCSLLCFLPQQHQPWQCFQEVQDDVRNHLICVIFFHAFLVWSRSCIQQDLLAWPLGMQHPLLFGNRCNHQYLRSVVSKTCNRRDM